MQHVIWVAIRIYSVFLFLLYFTINIYYQFLHLSILTEKCKQQNKKAVQRTASKHRFILNKENALKSGQEELYFFIP